MAAHLPAAGVGCASRGPGAGDKKMPYVALFIWLAMCPLLGGVMHHILRSAFSYRLVGFLAAPGLVVRKLAMTVAALVTGATVTQVNIYNLKDRDIGFDASGISTTARVLVPLAPLFACAIALQIVNAMLGRPVDLAYEPPALSSLDAGGASGFMLGMWNLMSQLVRHVAQADWGSLKLYALLGFLFSLSLGACVRFGKFHDAILGVALLALGLAALSALFGLGGGLAPGAGSAPGGGSSSRLALSLRAGVMTASGTAVVMMLGGLLAAILVSTTARVLEMVGLASSGEKGEKTAGSEERPQRRRAA